MDLSRSGLWVGEGGKKQWPLYQDVTISGGLALMASSLLPRRVPLS